MFQNISLCYTRAGHIIVRVERDSPQGRVSWAYHTTHSITAAHAEADSLQRYTDRHGIGATDMSTFPVIVRRQTDAGVEFWEVKPAPNRPGRPAVAAADRAPNRSIRLNSERWEKFRRLGREWLEQQIDKAA